MRLVARIAKRYRLQFLNTTALKLSSYGPKR